jgi:DNA-binding beta-propeller fold protein YncE
MFTLSRTVALGALLGFVVNASGSYAATVTAPVVFDAPAANSPAGPTSPGDPFGRILPSGRVVHPTGTSVVVGMNALGLALSPSGRYAIVSNDDELGAGVTSQLDGATTGGYSLCVVDTQTMSVVSRYRDPNESYFAGVVTLPDPAAPANTLVLASGGASNAVYAFDLDQSGMLTPDAHHTIAIPGPSDAQLANDGRSYPSTLVLGPHGTRAFVVDNLGNDVAQIDTATRTLAGPSVPVGYFPFGAALSSAGLLVANEGMMSYGLFPTPAIAPPFGTPPADLARASSLSVVASDPDGSLGGAVRAYVPLDRPPQGVLDVGGAHPAAIVAMHSKRYAFVSMSNVDRIATISLAGSQPKVAGGTELRLYNRGPYGTQPVALALARNERRLYVALAGIDAVAVLDTTDPRRPHRIGLIPTGWYPTALALSADGRYLFVVNGKGLGHDRGSFGDQPGIVDSRGRVLSVVADSSAVWSTLERIDLLRVDLRRTTPQALSYLRTIGPARNDPLVPQRFGTGGSTLVKHVVFILEESKSYDAVLGDLTDPYGQSYGPGDPNFVSFGASVTPNLHTLARNFALAGNFYADGEGPGTGHQFATGGIATAYTEKTARLRKGRRPVAGENQDPEDYPRAGYIFNSLAQRGKSYRDYGELLGVAGYDEGAAPDARTDDPAYAGADDTTAPTQSLGGLYAFDVPALLALSGHVDPYYPGWNPRIRDLRRAQEFLRDFDPLVRADRVPAFTAIWLPADRAVVGKGLPPPAEQVADGDRALGRIVEYLTRIPQWTSTAIFIMPADALASRDHINVDRSFALVVSPFAKHRYIGTKHLSTASVLKTEEELLGLPALSLGDALASDMRDFFTPIPDAAPYQHIDAGPQSF